MKAVISVEFIQIHKSFPVLLFQHGEGMTKWGILASPNTLESPFTLSDCRPIPGTRYALLGSPEDALKGLLDATSVLELAEYGLSNTTLTTLRQYLGIPQGSGKGGKRPKSGWHAQKRNKI